MSTGIGQTTDSREFLQQRVAAFGLAVAVILLLSLLVRLGLGIGFDYIAKEVAHPSFWAHAVSWVPVTLVWLICRSRPLGTRTIQEDVTKVDLNGPPFTLTTSAGETDQGGFVRREPGSREDPIVVVPAPRPPRLVESSCLGEPSIHSHQS